MMSLFKKKQFFWILLAVVVFYMFPVTAGAVETDVRDDGGDRVVSGTYGDVDWVYEESTGALTISGEGEMADAEPLYDDYSDDVIYEGIPWSGFSVRTVEIMDGVTGIGIGAFWNCSDLTRVQIADTVEFISRDAFSGCMALKEITIPKSVVSIEGRENGSNGLERIEVEAGNTMYSSIDGVLFNADQDTLKIFPSGRGGSYTIPDGVSVIGARAFYNSAVTGVAVPSGVRCIGNSAFSGCGSLQSVEIQEGVTELEAGCFRQCTGLKQIVLPDSVSVIPDRAFYGCRSLSSVSLGSRTSSIGTCAFINCDSLMEIHIPGSVVTIGDNALGYILYDHYDFHDYDTVADFVIEGYAGTEAQTYAKKNDMMFRVLEDGPAPKIVSLVNGAAGVKLRWGESEGISRYRVYRRTGSGSWSRLGSTDTASFTDKTAENGAVYCYTVRGVSEDDRYFVTDYDRAGRKIARLKTPSISSLKNVRSGKLMVKWKENTGASGYQIQYSSNSGFIKARSLTVSESSRVSAVISGLTKQKKYYVRVRAFKTVSKTKYYSGWSSAKSVMVR